MEIKTFLVKLFHRPPRFRATFWTQDERTFKGRFQRTTPGDAGVVLWCEVCFGGTNAR